MVEFILAMKMLKFFKNTDDASGTSFYTSFDSY